MKGLVIVNKGMEDVAAIEIKELIKQNSEIKEGAVLFEINDFNDLMILSYKGQSFARVLLLLKEIEIKTNDLQREFLQLQNADFSIAEKLVKDIKFAARSSRIGDCEFTSKDIEKTLGEIIYKTFPSVDLENPNITFFAYIFEKKCYLGIDFSGEIDTREYKIYTTPKELKASVAYSLLKIAGYDGKKSMLDCFSGSGTIAIEAALFSSNKSPRFFGKNKLLFSRFDKIKLDFSKFEKEKKAKEIFCSDALLHNVKSSEKNSKIADVNKLIKFSKIDIEWLDTKFDEKSVDIVCSMVPEVCAVMDEKEIKKMYKEFFHQLNFIMKKNCKIAAILRNHSLIKEIAKEFHFTATHEREVMQGKSVLKIVVFERAK
jgi:23S rRNA G2445 N2-methylase RlmL